MSAPPAPTSIAPIIAQWMDFDDDDTEGQEFAQAVASAIWDAILAQGHFAKWDGSNYWPDFWPDFPDERYQRTVKRCLVLPLAGLDTDTP